MTLVESENGGVLTIYSGEVEIGGVTLEPDDRWYWALYALRAARPAGDSDAQALAGVAPTKEAALAEFLVRWCDWIAKAGLSYADEAAGLVRSGGALAGYMPIIKRD